LRVLVDQQREGVLSLLAFVEHTSASADAYPLEAGRVLIAVIDEDRNVRPQTRAATRNNGGGCRDAATEARQRCVNEPSSPTHLGIDAGSILTP
jgi:hypothetical protein